MKHIVKSMLSVAFLGIGASAWAGDSVTVVTAQMSDGTNKRFEITESGRLDFKNLTMIVTTEASAKTETVQLSEIARLYFENAVSAGTESLNATRINLYPNPTKDIIYVSGIEGETEAVVASADGRIMMRSIVREGSEINLASLQSGVYYVILCGQTIKITRL